MKEDQAVILFAALAQETRLRVVRALVVAGPDGHPAGRVADIVGVSRSNLSFHLKELEHAGLVTARRSGTSIFYAIAFEKLAGLVAFLGENCCQATVSRSIQTPRNAS